METLLKYKSEILKGLLTAAIVGLGIFLKEWLFKDKPVKKH